MTVESYQRMSNKNIKKSPGIEGALCNCMGKMRNYNFGCQNSSFFESLFCIELAKRHMVQIYCCTFPHIWASMLLGGAPLCHSEHAYSMDNSQRNLRTGRAREHIFVHLEAQILKIQLLGPNHGGTFVGSMYLLVSPKNLWICHSFIEHE